MRGIKVGNILVYRNSTVCIVNNIIKEDEEYSIIGTDSSNNEHKGPFSDWKSVIHYKDELHGFEAEIFNNIITRREVEAR